MAASAMFDLLVLGGGSGGVRAARIAAQHGARVAIVEESRFGGTCVNLGCVPKKLFVYASKYRSDVQEASAYGWSVNEGVLDMKLDKAALVKAKDAEIARLNGIYERLLTNSGVTMIRGRGTFADANTIRVGSEEHKAKTILVAVGGRPVTLDIPGKELAIVSDDAFFLSAVPRSVLVVGGGYIATEFACIFHGMGSRVTQSYRGPVFLRGFDEDLRHHLAQQMGGQGIDLRFNTTLTKIEATGVNAQTGRATLRATLSDGAALDVDEVLVAVGREPYVGGLGLDAAGVEVNDRGAIKVDEWSRTTAASVFAVGDVTDRLNLTPVAIAEGHCFADTVFGGKPRRPDHRDVATAVFSNPPVGTVGLTEAAAREEFGGGVDVFKVTFRPMKHTMTKKDVKDLMKLVVDRVTQRVVGVHIISEAAPEIIQAVAIAIKMGATKADFDATMPVHPTAAEELVTLRTKEKDP